MMNNMASYFELRTDETKETKIERLCKSPDWSTMSYSETSTEKASGGELLLQAGGIDGEDLTSIDKLRQHIEAWAASNKAMEFVFDVGMDLRNCWGILHDHSGKSVCTSQDIKALANALQDEPPKFDDLGMSGSTIIDNMPLFVIKNVKNLQEYFLMKEAMPAIGEQVQNRIWQEGGCFSTALAPMCGTIAGEGGVQWLILRKLEHREAKPLEWQLGDDKVEKLDLKGPKFLGLRDGKTYFGNAEVKNRKDPGFATMFPHPLQLHDCGSRDAAYVLEKDSALLKDNRMTDYSLLVKFYQTPPRMRPSECACRRSKVPVWPVVVFASPSSWVAGRSQPMQLVLGVIDYIERGVNDDMIGGHLSTMKEPNLYQEWWMRMWPMYFQLPHRGLQIDNHEFGDGVGIMVATGGEPAEIFQRGQKVYALTKLKWAEDAKHKQVRSVSGQTRQLKLHNVPLLETSSSQVTKDSAFKVLAGEPGTLAFFERSRSGPGVDTEVKLLVKWDSLEQDRVFLVEPGSVIGEPRAFFFPE
mmetsp:Transcript_48715/g.139309  ORF Transcript_48715/g.139309 Transcript_48715/m.139309 type:complete len:527 (+) Transcript_48715:306-1886(+)